MAPMNMSWKEIYNTTHILSIEINKKGRIRQITLGGAYNINYATIMFRFHEGLCQSIICVHYNTPNPDVNGPRAIFKNGRLTHLDYYNHGELAARLYNPMEPIFYYDYLSDDNLIIDELTKNKIYFVPDKA